MCSTASVANIGGSASAPIIACAYHESYAGIGVLMGVLGAAVGNFMGLPEKVMRKKMAGDFAGAIEEMERLLAEQDLPEAMRLCLETNKEMIKRLPYDYPYSKEEAIELAKKAVPDFSEEEFDQLEKENKVGWIYVKGENRYFDRYFESLCKTDPAMAKRAGFSGELRNEEYFREAIEEMQKTGISKRRFYCSASVQLKDENFEKGSVVRAYLPIPCSCVSQSDIKLEKITPEPTYISSENAPQRVVFWEEKMEKNHPFTVEFSYVRTVEYMDLWNKNKNNIDKTKIFASHLTFGNCQSKLQPDCIVKIIQTMHWKRLVPAIIL